MVLAVPSRAQFAEQLRQPLCLALLRNCTSPYDEAYSAAARLFGAILLQPRLRHAHAWSGCLRSLCKPRRWL